MASGVPSALHLSAQLQGPATSLRAWGGSAVRPCPEARPELARGAEDGVLPQALGRAPPMKPPHRMDVARMTEPLCGASRIWPPPR